jgi:cytochrome oxidase Cu insertion factor (SCO1/SenC/PrrC family)
MLKLLVGSTLAGAAAFSMGGAGAAGRGVSARAAVSMASFHDFSATAMGGKDVSMSDFKGKPILVLNVASL